MKNRNIPPTRDALTAYLQDAEKLIQAMADSAGLTDSSGLRSLYSVFAVHALTAAPARSEKEKQATIKAMHERFKDALADAQEPPKARFIGRLFGRG